MSFLKTVIPLFIALGVLQAAILTLPIIYWRSQPYLNPIERYLFGFLLLLTAFVIHPLIVITLITFTIAPSLLSMRHDFTSRLSTVYTALVPSSLSGSVLGNEGILAQGPFENGGPQTGREWLMAVLGSYVGWKTLGAFPFVMSVIVFLALRGGKEGDVGLGGSAKGWARRGTSGYERVEAEKGLERRETGVNLRRRRTDVQVVG